MRDENIDKISEMLLRGGKMLSRHCPTCNSPLFKFGEEIICPVCGTSFAEVDAKEERKRNFCDFSNQRFEGRKSKICDFTNQRFEIRDFTRFKEP
jgi:Uncharacterized Zn-finger containing protein